MVFLIFSTVNALLYIIYGQDTEVELKLLFNTEKLRDSFSRKAI